MRRPLPAGKYCLQTEYLVIMRYELTDSGWLCEKEGDLREAEKTGLHHRFVRIEAGNLSHRGRTAEKMIKDPNHNPSLSG